MSKRKIIIMSFLAIFVVAISFLIYSSLNQTKTVNLESTTINTEDIQSQIDQITVLQNKVRFLTYRGTALAEIANGKVNIITDQIFPQELVDDIKWIDNDKALISFYNDSEKLTKLSGYVNSKNEKQYATFSLSKKTFTFIPTSVPEVSLLNGSIVGIKDNSLYKYNNGWKDIGVKTHQPVFSSTNKLLGDIGGNVLTIYNQDLNVLKTAKIKSSDPKNVRLFDDGTYSELIGDSLTIYKANNKKISLKINNTENLLFGENIILYSSRGTNNIFLPLLGKTYKVANLPKDLTYLNIFGLSNLGAIYTDQEDYSVEYWRINGE